MTDPQARFDPEARVDDEAPIEADPEGHYDETPDEMRLVDESSVPAADTAVSAVAPPDAPSAPAGETATIAATTTLGSATIPAAAERENRPRSSRKVPPAPRPLAPYAIIETGGKQYRVSVGERVSVEKLPVEAGTDLTFERVLLLGGDGTTRVGTPTVAGAAVTARVEEQYRGEKIIVFKYKAKKRYRRRQGHRQSLTRLTITGITA